MENKQDKKKDKSIIKTGKLLAKVGFYLLGGWWLFETFAKKNHTHDFLSAGANRGGSVNVLYINDENASEYLTYAKAEVVYDGTVNEELSYDYYGAKLTLYGSIDCVVFETTKTWGVSTLELPDGGYDGKRIVIAGNVALRPDSPYNEYCFSSHIYQDESNNNGKTYFAGKDKNGCEVMLFRKVWYFLV